MQKISSVILKINKRLVFNTGQVRFLLYFHWDDIVKSFPILENVKVDKIIFNQLNNCILFLISENSGISIKLHYIVPQIKRKIYQILGNKIDLIIKIK